MTDIRVPTLGESVTEATIGKWFKQPGDAVAVDEPLVELETDKVTIEVPAPSAGVLSEVMAKDGQTVAVGALLGQISEFQSFNFHGDGAARVMLALALGAAGGFAALAVRRPARFLLSMLLLAMALRSVRMLPVEKRRENRP